MRQMKYSGIEWIGEIPEDWGIVLLSSIFHQHKEKNNNLQEINLLSLSYGRIIKKDINTCEGLLPASFETYNIIGEGDIVFRLTDLQNDQRSLRTGLCTQKGIITSAYITLRNNIELDNRYMHYLYHSYDICKVFYGMGDGVRQGMNYDDLKKLLTLFPAVKEQQEIADFLDEKCAKIDGLIAHEQATIEELKVYKQSVITEAVTKGLDKSVPMKDSGVEWIGEIPESWEVVRIKDIATIRTGGTESKVGSNENYSTEDGLLWIKPNDLQEFVFINSTTEFLTKKAQINIKPFPPYTLFVCCIGTIGKFGVTNRTAYCNQQINGLIFNKAENQRFCSYAVISQTEQHCYYSTGNVVKILNAYNQGRIYIGRPPIEIQNKIADYLDKECANIDNLISIKLQKIEELKEYKKSLIYEYVTGKKEVA